VEVNLAVCALALSYDLIDWTSNKLVLQLECHFDDLDEVNFKSKDKGFLTSREGSDRGSNVCHSPLF
jgi:hypothetical protein